MGAAAINVRELARADLPAAAEFCERARAADPFIEPFAYRLPAIADGPRALLGLWRVAHDEDGTVHGVSFVALREERSAGGADRTTADVYVAVAPGLRRHGLGRALCSPAMEWARSERATLRARVRDEASAGRAFLRALGFAETAGQLTLEWSARPVERAAMPALRIRRLVPGDALGELERLSREAWSGAPGAFGSRSDEIARLVAEERRLVLVGETDRRAVGYLSAVWLGRTLAIEEVAVLPEFRRMGIGRALLAAALPGAAHAVLSVFETNQAARSLYRSFGFSVSARRLVYEWRDA